MSFLSSPLWAVFSLTVLLHALSVPRSLPPEGNDRFGLRLLIQGLHTARRIGTVAEKHAYKRAFFFFLLLKVPTDYIATGRLLSKILQQAFALTVQPCFFLFISKLQILPSWEKSVCFITHWKTFSHLFAETALVDGSHNESELSFNLNCTYRTTLLISCDSALARTHWVLIWAADSLFILRIFIPFWWACDLRSLYT